MRIPPAEPNRSLCDALPEDVLRTIDGLRSSLFTLDDQGMNLGLHVASDRIKRAQSDLRVALRDADRKIAVARASLADHPRHYGTDE